MLETNSSPASAVVSTISAVPLVERQSGDQTGGAECGSGLMGEDLASAGSHAMSTAGPRSVEISAKVSPVPLGDDLDGVVIDRQGGFLRELAVVLRTDAWLRPWLV